MVKRPTIFDLAYAAGVSVATVDRVLNRRLPVREDTALRVVNAAESIGYHAIGLLKRRLAEAPTRRFGFLLQKRSDAFYGAFGAELARATKAASLLQGMPFVEYVDEILPATIAARLKVLADRSEAVAIVAVDHPVVNAMVEDIVARGKPVITLLSDLTTPQRATYLAVDSRKAGRTAAWVISRAVKLPGKIGILIGSHRYLSQELAEISFRSYIREHASDLQLLEPIINLDDDRLAAEAVSDMMSSNPDLVGIYCSGGGQDGFIQALRETPKERRIVGVCNELTTSSKAALIDGTLELILGTPIKLIAEKAVEFMAMSTGVIAGTVPAQQLFPADIHISENI